MGLRYLALGDSYTIGESVAVSDRWPVELVSRLRKKGLEFEEPDIIAVTGWTTDELINAIEQKDPSEDYDLVTLLIGVNNQYRGYPFKQYTAEFELLLKTAIKHGQGQSSNVFVVSIPDYGVTPFAQEKDPDKIGREIDAYNSEAEKTCRKYLVPFINITNISKTALNDPELTADDNLHPSGKMYRMWVDEILPVVFSGISK